MRAYCARAEDGGVMLNLNTVCGAPTPNACPTHRDAVACIHRDWLPGRPTVTTYYATDLEAHAARRQVIRDGYRVSLIAPDPDMSDLFCFDTYSRANNGE